MNQCKVCLKSYVWPQDLQRHIKLKHPIKEKGDTENLHHQQKYTVFSQQQQQQQYSMSTQQQQNTSNNYLLGIHVSEPGIYDTSQNDYCAAAAADISVQTSIYCQRIGPYLMWKNLLCKITFTEQLNQNYTPTRTNNLAIQTVATFV